MTATLTDAQCAADACERLGQWRVKARTSTNRTSALGHHSFNAPTCDDHLAATVADAMRRTYEERAVVHRIER